MAKVTLLIKNTSPNNRFLKVCIKHASFHTKVRRIN